MTEARIEYAHISSELAPEYGIRVIVGDDGTGAAVVDIPNRLPDRVLTNFFNSIVEKAEEKDLETGVPLLL